MSLNKQQKNTFRDSFRNCNESVLEIRYIAISSAHFSDEEEFSLWSLGDLNRKWCNTKDIFMPVVLLKHLFPQCRHLLILLAVVWGGGGSLMKCVRLRKQFMGGGVRLSLEKQTGMLYEMCLVSPRTSHLVEQDGNYDKLWKCRS